MNATIQSLTEKIYKEGVEKANQQAESILAKAHANSEALLADANKQANLLIENAKKEAQSIKKNVEAELRLYANQAIGALKSEVTNVVSGEIVSSEVGKAMNDTQFMQELMLSLTKSFGANQDLVIECAQAKEVSDFFKSKAKELMDKQVEIRQVNGKSTSFTLSPADGSYKISFGEDEFIAFFEEYLRPQLFTMLFK